MLLFSAVSWGQTNIFSENIGTPTTTTIISNYITGTAPATFQNIALYLYSKGDQTNAADVRVTSPSSIYTGASGNGNIYFTSTSGAYGFSIEGINASGYSSLTLNYGYRKESATLHTAFSVDYWNGSAWVSIANTSSNLFNEAVNVSTGWYAAKQLSLPVGAQINGLKLRFVKTGTASIRIDDIKLTGSITTSTPTITLSPATLTGFTYVSGSGPSAEQTYTVSGANLSADITITPATNYEISLTTGTGFGSTITLARSGVSVSLTTIYVRLKAGLSVASYNSETIAATSAGSNNPTVACSGSVTAGSSTCLSEVFTSFTWTNSGSASSTDSVAGHYGAASPCRAFSSGNTAITPAINNPNTLSFYEDASSGGSGSTATIDYKIGAGAWTSCYSFSVNSTGSTKSVDLTNIGGIDLSQQSSVSFRFNSSFSTWYLDDVVILCGASCTPPSNPLGSITGTNPACGSTTLSYSGTASNPIVNYWQTTATGVSKTNNASSTITVSASASYYVRAYNAPTNCWSSSAFGPYAVVINTAPTISVNPVASSIADSANTSFGVMASGTGITYQWQVDTGSGFSNLSNATPYTTVTSATLNITGATYSMNGYTYRCVVSGTSPCTAAPSASASLTVALPTVAVPTIFTKGCTTNTSQSLSWSAPASGTFDGYLLVVRQAGTPNAVTSIVASSTVANLNYTIAPTYNSTTSRALYIGNGTSVTVTGLAQGTSYTFALYAYKNNGASTIYSTATTTTQVIGLSNITDVIATPLNGSGSVTWANPNALCYNQVLVVLTNSSGITFNPTGDGTNYSANSVFSSFDQVVYFSNGNLADITGLTNGVTYYIEIFIRNGTEWSSGVEVSLTPINIVPTILKTGDLLLVAYANNLTGGDDGLRLLSMVDINPGTKFLWSNATYETGGIPAANVTTDKWFECRYDSTPTGNVPYIEFTYTGSTVIPAASIFCITTDNGGVSTTISPVSPAGETLYPFNIIGKSANGTILSSHSPINVSTSEPDAMFLLQGNFIYSASGSTFKGNVLSAVQDGGLWYDLTDNLSGVTGSDLRRSRKHPSLICASIQAKSTPGTYSVSYNVSSTTYTSGNKPYLLGSILNFTTNWLTSFGSCPSSSPFVISPSDSFNKWTGAISTNWFDCNNWTFLSVPNETTDVVFNSTSTQLAEIKYNAPFSSEFLKIAKCKDLTVSGKNLLLEANLLNKLQVHGNLLINSDGILDMDDSDPLTNDGQLFLYGNWTNSSSEAAFQEGNGTVHFLGNTTQVVNSNVHNNPENFYNIVLDNNFNTATSNNLIAKGNLEVKTNKNFTVAPNDYTVVNKKLTNNGLITIDNNGQLIQVDETDTNDGVYSGTNFKVNRIASINKFDYVYWSSPVDNFNVSNIAGSYKYSWNPIFTNSNGTKGNWTTASGIMTKGKGYIVRAPNSFPIRPATATTLPISFLGKPNNGQFDFGILKGDYNDIEYDAEPSNPNNELTTKYDDNWNLIGNPYPSAIDAEDFLVLNSSKIEGAVWIWKHGTAPNSSTDPFYQNYSTNYSSSDYLKYNGLGSTEPDTFDGKIASGQGFMVNMLESAGSTNTITFQNSLRAATHNNSNFYRNATTIEEKSRIWLNIINTTSGKANTTLVGYSTHSTLGEDHLYDCVFIPEGELAIYSLLNTNPFVIQGRGLPFDSNDTVPLGMKIMANGNYKIAINTVDGLFESTSIGIYLEDKLLNSIHDLRQSPYTFTANIGRIDDRFVLRYSDQALGTPTFEAVANAVLVANKNNQINIQSSMESIESVIVYDVLGRSLLEKSNIKNNAFVITNLALSNQTLIVKIVLENGQTVTKKIVF